MATNNQNIPRQPPTRFAQKYGLYTDGKYPQVINALQGYKSGHTPLSARRLDESEARKKWKSIIYTSQFRTLRGFPMSWVRAVRAYIPTAEIDHTTTWEKVELHNPIHPLIELSQWETLDGCSKSYPPPLVGNGLHGFMIAENPIVWDVLKPILQLTTCFLDNAHLWPWWDALLSEKDSDNKETRQNPYNKAAENLFFRLRTPEEVFKQAVAVKDLLRAMSGHWLFRLRSMYRCPTQGSPEEPGVSWFGVTVSVGGPGKGAVTINTEMINGLLTTDLTEPERIMLVTCCARTLAHEIAHVVGFHYQDRCDPRAKGIFDPNVPEPYLQDEALNELGHSMEQSVFKSNQYPIMSNNDGLALMMYNADFPFPGIHRADGDTQYLPVGIDKEPQVQARTAVPIESMRMLLFPDFWGHYINRYGGDVINPDPVLAERHANWDGRYTTYHEQPKAWYGTRGARNSQLEAAVADIPPEIPIMPDMSLEENVSAQFVNMRRRMQMISRQGLGLVMEGYTIDPNTGEYREPIKAPAPAPQEQGAQGPAQMQGGPQVQGQPPAPLPQEQGAQEPAQIQGGPQVQGQPPALLPQEQEAPARAPTPTSPYQLPGDVQVPLSITEVRMAHEIASHIKYFRNVLGLHCIATCTEDALWFHLALLVRRHLNLDVSFEDWKSFLKACNSSGEMLSWDPETKLIHALRSGWEPHENSMAPLPCPALPEATLKGADLHDLIRRVAFFICCSPDFGKLNEVTWYDEEQVAFQFNIIDQLSAGGHPMASAVEFKEVCLTYFSSCWTTGPPGCIQFNAPNHLRRMLKQIRDYMVDIAQTTDIGTVLDTDAVRNAINVAFEGDDTTEFIRHPRHFLVDNENWWQKALLDILCPYFGAVIVDNQLSILYTFKWGYTVKSLRHRTTEVQIVAFNDFIEKYWADPNTKRKCWPLELRALYNNIQKDESTMFRSPPVFFSCLYMPLPMNYLRVTDEREILFNSDRPKPPVPVVGENTEGQNAQGQNTQGGAQGGEQQGNQGGAQGGPQAQEGNQIQGGHQPQGGPQVEGVPHPHGGARIQGGAQIQGLTQPQFQGGTQPQAGAHPQGQSGIPILTQPQNQGGWAPGQQQQQQQQGNAGNQWQQGNTGQQGNQGQQENQGQQGM